MKKTLSIALFIICSSAYADYCSENNNQLETTSIGTIIFDKASECREAYKIAQECSQENVRMYEKNPLKPRRDCEAPLKDYMLTHKNKILAPKP